jgi:hypothetical protein
VSEFIPLQMLWKRLEGNLAFEGGIFGKVDFPHAALTQLLRYTVAASRSWIVLVWRGHNTDTVI